MYKPEANNSSHQVPTNVFTKYRHYIHFSCYHSILAQYHPSESSYLPEKACYPIQIRLSPLMSYNITAMRVHFARSILFFE